MKKQSMPLCIPHFSTTVLKCQLFVRAIFVRKYRGHFFLYCHNAAWAKSDNLLLRRPSVSVYVLSGRAFAFYNKKTSHTMKKINVLIVDDHAMVRESLCRELQQHPLVEGTYEASV